MTMSTSTALLPDGPKLLRSSMQSLTHSISRSSFHDGYRASENPPTARSEKNATVLMLIMACCLSVGSHYGSHLLGPLKTALKTSESGFSSLISSFELMNTITPLISGFLIDRFGAPVLGIAASGAVLLGQVIVCYYLGAEDEISVGSIVFGLLIFGMGMSPLAIVQESIIIKSRTKSTSNAPIHNNHMAKTMGAGLLLGKTASFVSASTSKPLSHISPRMPFVVAVCLSTWSFGSCLIYAWLERRKCRTEYDQVLAHIQRKHTIHLRDVPSFGDPFYIYIFVCTLAGLWFTTSHLSSSLLETIYGISADHAGISASMIPGASIMLYPLLGYLLDKYGSALKIAYKLVPTLMIVSFLTLIFFTWLVPYYLALVPAAIGIGYGPLLLVVVVPRLVKSHQVSTALGLHKSLEMAGASLIQASTSFLLSATENRVYNAKMTVTFMCAIAAVMLVTCQVWWRMIETREKAEIALKGEREEWQPMMDTEEPAHRRSTSSGSLPDYGTASKPRSHASPTSSSVGSILDDLEVVHAHTSRESLLDDDNDCEETRRGRFALWACFGTIIASWTVFIYNLLRS